MKYSSSAKTDRTGISITALDFESIGYIFREQPIVDCGIDAHLEVVESDSATGKLIALQIKSGDSWFKESNNDGFVFRGKLEHLEYWLSHSLPVLLVLCDTNKRICYWQSITKQTIEYTDKAWKVTVPYQQTINAGMHVDIARIVNPLAIHSSYTFNKLDDYSHARAKRYGARITLTKEYRQAELIYLLAKLTKELVYCDFHRSDYTRRFWREHPAHVVWITVFPSPNDEKNNNPICETEWFSPDLEDEYAPTRIGGDLISDGLYIKWNKDYLITSKYNELATISKEEFVTQVDEIVELAVKYYDYAVERYHLYKANGEHFKDLLEDMCTLAQDVNTLYSEAQQIGLSSFECKPVAIKFGAMLCSLDNMYMHFTHKCKFPEKQKLANLKVQSEQFVKDFQGFTYERGKL